MDRGPGERYLQNQLRVQRETLERRGVEPDIVAAEIGSLELAIRSAACTEFSREGLVG
jgi:hypothetical protein